MDKAKIVRKNAYKRRSEAKVIVTSFLKQN